MKNSRSGFTLIETMVVISLAAVLATLVMAYVQSARLSARDSVRDQEYHQIGLAVELYKATYNKAPDLQGDCGYGSSIAQTNPARCTAISTMPTATAQGYAWGQFVNDLHQFLPAIPNVPCLVNCSETTGAFTYVSPGVLNVDSSTYGLSVSHERGATTSPDSGGTPGTGSVPSIYDLNNGSDESIPAYVVEGTAYLEGYHLYNPNGSLHVHFDPTFKQGDFQFEVSVPTSDTGHGSEVDIPTGNIETGLYVLSVRNDYGVSNGVMVYIPEGDFSGGQ